MKKIGLKLASFNDYYIKEAVKLYQESLYDYIELYVKPNTYKDFILKWSNLNIPFIIHAPHFGDGVNLSNRNLFDFNIQMINESIKFADTLNAEYIICHPGVNGSIDETIHQLMTVKDKRIIVENKPQKGMNNEICIGHSPYEIKEIVTKTEIGFCLDIGHAICSANSKNMNPLDFIKEFINLNPVMYHLTDGDFKSEKDSHEHYTEGSYPLKQILLLIPDHIKITNEAKKESDKNLNCFRKDVIILQELDNNFIIRKALNKDVKSLFDLANEDDIRRFSFHSDKIEFNDHEKWFYNKLNEKNYLFLVCEINQKVIGQLRYEIDNNTAIIGISLKSDMRNSGASKIFFHRSIDFLKQHFPDVRKINALIKQDNKRSIRYFQKMGFKTNEEVIVKNIQALKYTYIID
jgi:deoxyribonuclease IV